MGDDGQHDIELEVARLAANGDGRVVADHLCGHHGRRLWNNRIHLAGHYAAAWLQRGKFNLADARQRAAVHPPQIVRDFGDAHSDCF